MMGTNGMVGPTGALSLEVIRAAGPPTSVPPKALTSAEILKFGAPRPGLRHDVNAWRLKNLPHLWRGHKRLLLARAFGLPNFYGQLSLMVARCKCGDPDSHVKRGIDGGDPRCPNADWIDFGLASLRVVTNAGVDFIVDAFQNIVELEIMKFHGLGLGSTAENATDTDIETELTTQYQTDNTRATGTTVEGASSNIYRTVATNTVDATAAIREHGILTLAAVGSGVLLDRTVFALVTLENGDSLQTTYDLTVTAGS